MTTRLATLMARREELLVDCAEVDRRASQARELGVPLGADVIAGFRNHVELRAVEHAIAKMKESKK